MLELDQVGLSLGARNWRFTLDTPANSINAILGRSGSGKSTLLNLIAGFLNPTSGDIRWQGQSLLPLAPDQRPITTLFQQYNLFPHLSVSQNVGLGIHPGLKLSKKDWQEVETSLHEVGLSGQEHKLPADLSGGEQQRAALARCLIRQQPILLLDEPFSALDEGTRAEMINLTRRVIDRYSPCVFMVTHEIDDARALDATLLKVEHDEIQVWQ